MSEHEPDGKPASEHSSTSALVDQLVEGLRHFASGLRELGRAADHAAESVNGVADSRSVGVVDVELLGQMQQRLTDIFGHIQRLNEHSAELANLSEAVRTEEERTWAQPATPTPPPKG